MKTKIIVFVVLLSVLTVAFISTDTFQVTTGPHGGRLQEVDDFNIETKTAFPNIYTYLLNKQCQPISNTGVSCEIKFFLTDGTTLDIPLKPYEVDGFTMESSILSYNSYRVTFHAFGKPVSAKFENENAIVQKK